MKRVFMAFVADRHCTLLVSRSIHEALLHTLDPPASESINVQHAVFGALRNLAIPRENSVKSPMTVLHAV